MSMKPVKISFEQLNFEVNKMYERDFAQFYQSNLSPEQLQEADKKCEFLTDFVEACGWSLEEYYTAWFNDISIN